MDLGRKMPLLVTEHGIKAPRNTQWGGAAGLSFSKAHCPGV
jgi:hypothetical protein